MFSAGGYGLKRSRYFEHRFDLFKRFDSGIWLNDEGWYSVTPEDIADAITARIVERLKRKEDHTNITNAANTDESRRTWNIHLMDAFCGPGGNVISFAKHPDVSLVTGIDINPDMLCIAEHNALVYKLDITKIRFLNQNMLDTFDLSVPAVPSKTGLTVAHSSTPVSAVLLSPPWGGPTSTTKGKGGSSSPESYRLDTMPVSLYVFRLAAELHVLF